MKATAIAFLVAAGIVMLALPALYVAFLVAAAFMNGFTLAEMDWNKDGRTTLSEIVYAANVGERQSIDDPRCRELFSTKMGSPPRSYAQPDTNKIQTETRSLQKSPCV